MRLWEREKRHTSSSSSGAHPRLHVTHLKPKWHTSSSGGSQLAHLLQRATDLVHGVIEVGEAVLESGGGTVVGFNPLTSTKINHKQTHPFNNKKHNSNITTTQSEQPQHRSKTNLNQIYKPKLLYKQTTAKPTSFATSNHQEKRFGAEMDDWRPPHEGQRSPQWAKINPTSETHGSQKN